MKQKKVYIDTYGCSNNYAESQIMAGLLSKSGFDMVDNEKSADVVIVNTCSVKDKTESKIMHKLSSFSELYPGKKLIVSGCLPEAELNRVKKIVPNSSIVGTNHIDKIHVAVDLTLDDHIVEFVGKNNIEKVSLPKLSVNPVIDIVPISSGCMSHCNFCSTKLAKGDLVSYHSAKIVDEIKSAKIGGGAKEFWLTSQDCGCFGFENGGNIATLLKDITSSVSGTYYIRLGMANPQHLKRIIKELIDAYRDDHIFKFIHIPLQSGSDEILRNMQRGHRTQDFNDVVNEFRKAFPEINVWTDIIVGFPGETDNDFERTMKILQEIKPDMINISMYSPRPGTKASKMKQLTTEVKKARTRKASIISKKIMLEKNTQWVGWMGKIIVDEFNRKKGNFIGRNYTYKPVVIKDKCEMGQILEIKIIDATETYLIGEAIK